MTEQELKNIIYKRRIYHTWRAGGQEEVGSGFPTILKAWEEQGWQTPELIEDTALNQVTLVLKMKPEAGEMNGDQNFVQKNERSLKEVLKEVLTANDYEKMLFKETGRCRNN